MAKKLSDHQPNNLTPNTMFKSERVKFDNIPEGELAELSCDKPIEVRINGGKWIKLGPNNR